MKKCLLLFALFFLCFKHNARAQIITTIAGDGTDGYTSDSIPAVSSELARPIGVAIDAVGNVYIGDRDNNRIRKINTSGIITTIAGTGIPGYSGDETAATAAEIKEPYGVTVDNAGNVYFADGYNNCIRKINTVGIISTIAGIGGTYGYNGDNIPATSAQLYGPSGVAVDIAGNVYLTDGGNNRIRKVNTSGIITTIAGTGTAADSGDNGLATAAEVSNPYSILLDEAGNLYTGGQYNSRVRKINTSGIITTVAGTGTTGFSGDNGPATGAKIGNAVGLAIDEAGNLYISDNSNYRIRKVNASGIITTYAGDGIGDYNGDNLVASTAQLDPVGLALDGTGNLYIADFGNDRIRHITSTVSVNTLNATADRLTIYPNPSTGDFTINLSSAINEQANVLITNVEGARVKEFSASTNRPQIVALDERTGLYFISVTTSKGTYNTKLVITQ